MESASHIVIVEDEAIQRQLLVTYLTAQGFRVSAFDRGGGLRTLLERELPDLVLLDVRLPGEDGFSLARYVRDHGLSDKRDLRVKTSTSLLELHLLEDGQVRVNMGAPRFEPAQIPMLVQGNERSPEYGLTLADGTALACGAVSMGNPHAVIEVADVDSAPVAAIGEELQHHPAFPEKVNAGFVQFVDGGHARLRVHERGTGETLACGSGACAAMVVGRIWGKLGAHAAIQVRGGALQLEWAGEGQPVYMTGPAETVFEGSLVWPK